MIDEVQAEDKRVFYLEFSVLSLGCDCESSGSTDSLSLSIPGSAA